MRKTVAILLLVLIFTMSACNNAPKSRNASKAKESYSQEDLIGTWELPITLSVEDLLGTPMLDADVTLKAWVIFYDEGDLWMGFVPDSIEDNRDVLTEAMRARLEASAEEAGCTIEELVVAVAGTDISLDTYIAETLDYYFAELKEELPTREEERLYEVSGNRLIIMDYSYSDEDPRNVVDARFEFRIQGDTLVLEECDTPAFAEYLGIELPTSLTKISDEAPY